METEPQRKRVRTYNVPGHLHFLTFSCYCRQPFELSQHLKEKWLTADYTAKRQSLEIILLNLQLNNGTLGVELRKPFDVLFTDACIKSGGGDGSRTHDLCIANAL